MASNSRLGSRPIAGRAIAWPRAAQRRPRCRRPFPRLMLDHAKASARAAGLAREGIRHLADHDLGAAGRAGAAPGLRLGAGRHAARRPHGGGGREPAAPVRRHAGRAGAGRGAGAAVPGRGRPGIRLPDQQRRGRASRWSKTRSRSTRCSRCASNARSLRTHLVRRPARPAQVQRAGARVAGRADRTPGERTTRPTPASSTPRWHKASPTTWRRCSSPRGTTGNPKGVVHTHFTPARPRRGRPDVRQAHRAEEVLAYMPPAWIGQNIFSYAQWLACGYVVNCPESAATVTIDLKEIGPTYYFAPPRIFEGLLTSVMIRMEDAGAIKRGLFHHFMDVARRVGPALHGRQAGGLLDRLAYALGDLSIYGPLRNTLGFSRVRVAYTAGEAIGPDLFTFYRSIGINLKQLYGSTETAVFVCLQPDHEARADTVGVPIDGVEIKLADNGEILVKSPGPAQGVLQEPGRHRRGADRRRLVPHRRCRLPGRRRPPEDHRPRQGRGPHRGRRQRRRHVRAQVRREQAQVLPLHQGGGGLRRQAREGLRLHQHRLRSRGQLGRAAQPALCRLHRPGAQARGATS